MAKLEELSELLVSEIEQFEKTVKKLQQIQKQKIMIDSRTLESEIRQHQESLEQALFSHKQEMKSLGHSLEKAKAYPSWALITFMASLITNVILVYVLFFEH